MEGGREGTDRIELKMQKRSLPTENFPAEEALQKKPIGAVS